MHLNGALLGRYSRSATFIQGSSGSPVTHNQRVRYWLPGRCKEAADIQDSLDGALLPRVNKEDPVIQSANKTIGKRR